MAEALRFYFDEHIDSAVAAKLRQMGIDILTIQEAGRGGLPDHDQLAFATADSRVMLTFDQDYLVLHSQGVPHAGIAWSPATKHSIGSLILALERLHKTLDAGQMINRLEYL